MLYRNNNDILILVGCSSSGMDKAQSCLEDAGYVVEVDHMI